MIAVTLPAAPAPTDFSLWERETLERFARQAADENKQLRDDLQVVLTAYRQLLKEQK